MGFKGQIPAEETRGFSVISAKASRVGYFKGGERGKRIEFENDVVFWQDDELFIMDA